MNKLSIRVQQSHDDKSLMLIAVIPPAQHKSTNNKQYSLGKEYV
jgi:hypothetical protein